jgi:FlgD Ig-like domain
MKGKLTLVVLLCLAATPSLAQADVPWHVVSGGGTTMGGSHTIRGTVAQTTIGPVVSPSYRMQVGFWHEYKAFVSATPEAEAFVWALQAAYPNPFNPRTTIRYSLPEESHVALRVYDVRGSLVATLVDGTVDAGDHVAVWNGRSNTGSGVASGLYFARIDSKHGVLTRKMVLNR